MFGMLNQLLESLPLEFPDQLDCMHWCLPGQIRPEAGLARFLHWFWLILVVFFVGGCVSVGFQKIVMGGWVLTPGCILR